MILTSQECIEIFKVLPINYNKIILEHIESGISDTNTIKLRNAMILYALDKIEIDRIDTDKIDSLFDVLYEEFSLKLHIAHGERASKRQFIQLICEKISNKYPKQGRRPPSLSDTDATALDEFTNETLSRLSRSSTPTSHPHKPLDEPPKRKAPATAGSASSKKQRIKKNQPDSSVANIGLLFQINGTRLPVFIEGDNQIANSLKGNKRDNFSLHSNKNLVCHKLLEPLTIDFRKNPSTECCNFFVETRFWDNAMGNHFSTLPTKDDDLAHTLNKNYSDDELEEYASALFDDSYKSIHINGSK